MVLYLWAIAAIALTLSRARGWCSNAPAIPAGWTFPVGLVSACESRTSMLFPLPMQKGVVT
jgi:hypothetical protein